MRPAKHVVFVVPVIPAFSGNGLAMRAAATLKLLAESFPRVHLLVVPVSAGKAEVLTPDVEALCHASKVVDNSAGHEALSAAIQAWRPDLLVIFRLYLAPVVLPAAGVPAWLDADELESTSRSRLADLYSLRGYANTAAQHRRDAAAYQQLEQDYLPLFERVFASSDREAQNMRTRHPDGRVLTLPNTYPLIAPQPDREPDGIARLLYVGTLSYYPNWEAIVYFGTEVLPLIRARSPIPVEVTVIGMGCPLRGEHPDLPGIRFVGPVDETTSFYAQCDAVIVPLRAAGGTRIKILEAFSHRRAVISTSIGAEGLDVTPGVDLQIADEAESFADACVQLTSDPAKRHAFAQRGHEVFLAHHTFGSLKAKAPDLFGT